MCGCWRRLHWRRMSTSLSILDTRDASRRCTTLTATRSRLSRRSASRTSEKWPVPSRCCMSS